MKKRHRHVFCQKAENRIRAFYLFALTFILFCFVLRFVNIIILSSKLIFLHYLRYFMTQY